MKTVLFMLYGIGVGLAYAFILSLFFHLWVTIFVFAGIIIATIVLISNIRHVKASEIPFKQLALLLPLVPIVVAVMVTIVAIVIVVLPFVYLIIWPFLTFFGVRHNRRFRQSMKLKGRFTSFGELQPTLINGEGTLIVETAEKGPYRIWWTEDDLFAFGIPVSTREELISIRHGEENAFNSRCVEMYLDEENGKGILTSIPAHYARTTKLSQLYPKMKVAQAIKPLY